MRTYIILPSTIWGIAKNPLADAGLLLVMLATTYERRRRDLRRLRSALHRMA